MSKNKRVKLTRCNQGEVTFNDPKDCNYGNWLLCADGLYKYFKVAKKVNKIDLILSTTKTKDSYLVRTFSDTRIRVSTKSGVRRVLVYTSLTNLIDSFKQTNKDQSVYLSIEV